MCFRTLMQTTKAISSSPKNLGFRRKPRDLGKKVNSFDWHYATKKLHFFVDILDTNQETMCKTLCSTSRFMCEFQASSMRNFLIHISKKTK